MQVDASCSSLELLIASLKKKRKTGTKSSLIYLKEVISGRFICLITVIRRRVWKIVDFSSILELRDF